LLVAIGGGGEREGEMRKRRRNKPEDFPLIQGTGYEALQTSKEQTKMSHKLRIFW